VTIWEGAIGITAVVVGVVGSTGSSSRVRSGLDLKERWGYVVGCVMRRTSDP
jgi:hypothetical protein